MSCSLIKQNSKVWQKFDQKFEKYGKKQKCFVWWWTTFYPKVNRIRQNLIFSEMELSHFHWINEYLSVRMFWSAELMVEHDLHLVTDS